MDDLATVLLGVVVAFIFGFIAAIKLLPMSINEDCANYGLYATEKYILTCKAKP